MKCNAMHCIVGEHLVPYPQRQDNNYSCGVGEHPDPSLIGINACGVAVQPGPQS